MITRPRIIPTLLIDDGDLIKTRQFKRPVYLGDPINAIKIFNEKCVDELCIMDISASKDKKEPDYELLQKMASESFMPLSYGGGIQSTEQMRRIFRCGFEKVIVNSAMWENKQLISEAAEYFGSQSIVVSIDYRKVFGTKKYRCYSNDGILKHKITPLEVAKEAELLGAGEILLYSIDRDGMGNGYDEEIVKEVIDTVNIPIIACGGANSLGDIKKVIDNTSIKAVAAGSMFVFYGKRRAVLINYPSEKELIDNRIIQL